MKKSGVKSNYSVMSNVVKKDTLRYVQLETTKCMAEIIGKSMGPHGSTTQIINEDALLTKYTKDGADIAGSVLFNGEIENNVKSDIVDICNFIASTVGDGTSTAVQMCYRVLKVLYEIEKEESIPSFKIISTFKHVVENMKKEILSNSREVDLEAIKNIATISSNSNVELVNFITDIYKTYGTDVWIDLGSSINENTYVKEYDGLTLPVGFSDPAYVNTPSSNEAVINNASVYFFEHGIDTREMTNYFLSIWSHNIYDPYMEYVRSNGSNKNILKKIVPTVILAPNMCQDNTKIIENIVSFMYNFNDISQRPPFLFITNINPVNMDMFYDVARLSGAQLIKKYINGDLQKQDQENGEAPTVENVWKWCGKVAEVRAKDNRTAFLEPDKMWEKKDGVIVYDEEGKKVKSSVYAGLLEFIKTEIESAKAEGENIKTIYSLKKRYNQLSNCMVELLIGGINASDRESLKALADDAVKNIRSAIKSGYGFAANFESLRAIDKIVDPDEDNKSLNNKIAKAIRTSLIEIVSELYQTSGITDEEAKELIEESLTNHICPYNLVTEEFDGKVLTSIETDTVMLDCIAKVITIMATTNQVTLPKLIYNQYPTEMTVLDEE